MNFLTDMAKLIVCVAVLAAFSCFGQMQPTTVQVDVNNFVLYNYDTFDTGLFGMNPSATNVMMKTYNYHVSIADIIAVGGTPAKGTLLCTHTMFVLSPTAVAGSGRAIADTKATERPLAPSSSTGCLGVRRLPELRQVWLIPI